MLTNYFCSFADPCRRCWTGKNSRFGGLSASSLTLGFDSYPDLKARLNHQVVLLPELQEVNHHPCDTGSSRAFLEEHDEFVKAGLDFSQIDESEKRHGVEWTSKSGFFDAESVVERAKWVRRWLRERKEDKIVGESSPKSRDEAKESDSARLPSNRPWRHPSRDSGWISQRS